MLNGYPDPTQERIMRRIADIAPALELLPGVAIIHDIRDGSVIYMSSRGLQELNISLEELRSMGTGYYEKFFNAEEAREYVPKMLEMVERNDPAETFTFFQQVRFGEDQPWHWHLSSIRILEHDEDDKPIATLTLAQRITPDQHYTPKIERLLDELSFLRKNALTYSTLSHREQTIVKQLSKGMTSQQIAEELHISFRTVETHRKNIRRKLNIKTASDLDRYARAFDLI